MSSTRILRSAKWLGYGAVAWLGLGTPALAQTTPTRILFVGNSFTHGRFDPVRTYNSANVTDENFGLPSTSPRYESQADESGPWGGIPGIFKKFTDEAGLNYEVHIEAISAKTLQYHYANALSVIGQPWHKVVLQEYSTGALPNSRGGNRTGFYAAGTSLAQAIHKANAQAEVYLYETWARADLVYPTGRTYSGLPVDTMFADLHKGYYGALAGNSHYAGVAPAGDAWLRAISSGVALRNPYSPDATKLNLWGADNYHPSKWGAYLNACVLFYRTTGVDPRTLGAGEQAAAALGITSTAAVALQQVAYQQVVGEQPVPTPAPTPTPTPTPTPGTAFTPGNVVVVRVGTGAAPLSAAAAPVFLAEYTPTGTLVRSLPLPTADAGSDLSFTDSGTAYSDNSLTRSADGRYLVLTGYHAAPGTAGIVSTAAATTNRLIGRVAADGTINTSTRISDAFDPTNIRAAASLDGTSFYAVGGNSTVRYLPLGNAGPTTSISTGSQVNFRSVSVYGGNLYVTTAASPNFGISQVGAGLPTTSGAAVRLLPGFSTVSGSPYAMFFADLSPAVAGPDVVYVVDDSPAGGIQKWSLVGSTWKLNGTIGGSTTALLRGLAGMATGTSVSLVASSSNALYSVADAAGYNAAPSVATLPQPFAKPPTNTVFRGVAFAPQAPAPSSNTLVATQATTDTEATVFPVPADRQLTVQLPAGRASGPAQAALFNKMGQQVLSQQAPEAAGATLTFNTQSLPSGTYTLRLLVGGRTTSKQVVITH
jgi:hypothetical protein